MILKYILLLVAIFMWGICVIFWGITRNIFFASIVFILSIVICYIINLIIYEKDNW